MHTGIFPTNPAIDARSNYIKLYVLESALNPGRTQGKLVEFQARTKKIVFVCNVCHFRAARVAYSYVLFSPAPLNIKYTSSWCVAVKMKPCDANIVA